MAEILIFYIFVISIQQSRSNSTNPKEPLRLYK